MPTLLYRNLFGMTLALAAAIGCDPNEDARVFVEYEQIANFPVYLLSPDSSSSFGAGDGMFILYKIDQIKNTRPAPVTFTFDVNDISTITNDQTSNETVIDGNILLGGLNLTTHTVPPNATHNDVGCFIKQALTSDPKSLATFSALVPLIYAGTQDQPVTMTRAPGDTDVALVSNALPNPLQELCASR